MTTKEQILKCFKDIDHAYNDCTRYDTLKCMLDELQEPCEDAISRQGVAEVLLKYVRPGDDVGKRFVEFLLSQINALPSVTPQEPCEDAISREAVLKIIDGWYEQNRDTDNIKDLIVLITYMDSVNPQKLNINEVLDKIRTEIDEQYDRVHPYNISCAEGLEMALNIVDKYIAEEDKA